MLAETIATSLTALMVIGLITVTGTYHDNISKLHISWSFIMFNIFIMGSLFYAIFKSAVTPSITLFVFIWFISIVVMLATQTTDGFTGINL